MIVWALLFRWLIVGVGFVAGVALALEVAHTLTC
jgi:hypothetical protein